MYPYSTQSIQEDDKSAVLCALDDEHLTQGWRAREFESAIARTCGARYASVCNSATSALYAAYHAIKSTLQSTQSTSKVAHNSTNAPIFAITTPISFVATTNMMLANNFTPLFADITPSGHLDPISVREILTSHPHRAQVKLLVSMDYGGRSVDCTQMRQLAQEFDLIWLSDSSHAFGARFEGQRLGTQADVSVFSFHAIKPITTAEGGALVTNDERIHAHASRLISHGITKGRAWEYDCLDCGFNFRMHELSAALGLSQIQKIESFIAKREEIARFYDSHFAHNPFFTLLPPARDISTHHLYPIFLHPRFWAHKIAIFESLHARGVGVQVHYIPIHTFSLYKQRFGEIHLQNALRFYNAELSIPCAQNMGRDDARKVGDIILDVLDSYKRQKGL